MTTTTYDIRVRYLMDDRASKGLNSIAAAAQRGARQTSQLGMAIRRLALGVGGFLTFRAAKRALIDYNSELEQARIQMEGLLSLNMGGSFLRNQQRANFLMRRFREDAKRSVGTTKDFIDMGSLLTGPLTRAGASMQDIADITKGAVIASRAFGVEAEFAARDIEAAVLGTLNKKDRFARALLEPMGLTTDAWNEMVTETPHKAAEMLTKAFQQPAIMQMAKRQEKSWAGITSTLQDNLQRAFGAIGLPLMQRMTKEAERLVKWFDDNPQRVKQITDNIADGMLKAFELAKKTFAWIVEHKDLLMTLAQAYLVGKVAGGIAGGVMNTVGMIKSFGGAMKELPGMLSKLRDGVAGSVAAFNRLMGAGGLTSIITKLGLFGMALGGLALAANAVANNILQNQEERIKRTTDNPLLREQGRALGGGNVSVGTSGGAQRRARQLGFKDRPYASAGEQLMAARVATGAREAGFLKKTGLDVRRIAGNFGVTDHAAPVLARAQNRAGGADVFARLTPTQMAEKLHNENRYARSEEVRHMIEFLRGLDRAMLLDRQQRSEKFTDDAQQFLGAYRDLLAKHEGDQLRTLKTFGGMLFQHFFPEHAVGSDKGTVRGKNETNVTIQKIEVVSDDPDRFAFNLVGAFEDYNKSPTQAAGAIAER